MADAELFAHPGYPLPGHGKVWFSATRDGGRMILLAYSDLNFQGHVTNTMDAVKAYKAGSKTGKKK